MARYVCAALFAILFACAAEATGHFQQVSLRAQGNDTAAAAPSAPEAAKAAPEKAAAAPVVALASAHTAAAAEKPQAGLTEKPEPSKKNEAGVEPLSEHLPEAVEQRLRICNGYANQQALDIVLAQVGTLSGSPLEYKQCKDFRLPLSEGDRLDFKEGGSTIVGSFTTTNLPRVTSSLLLVVHRRDAKSGAMAFQSHSYSGFDSPQVAAIDAYKGPHGSRLQIEGMRPSGKSREKGEAALVQTVEAIQFSTVFAVSPGSYNISLNGEEGKRQVQLLDAQAGKEYVAMRVGLHGTSSEYEEELVLFGAAAARGVSLGALLACLALAAGAARG